VEIRAADVEALAAGAVQEDDAGDVDEQARRRHREEDAERTGSGSRSRWTASKEDAPGHGDERDTFARAARISSRK